VQNLKQLGIKTFVNLRLLHSDRKKIDGLEREYEHIHVKAWRPKEEEAVRFLRIVSNPQRTPVLVHCHYGADRTGVMVAVYRIAIQGWTKDEAIREMTEGGFGFHPTWSNLPKWIQKLNIESLKSRAGIKGTE
jgi:protein tyrosine/serine phosphatase